MRSRHLDRVRALLASHPIVAILGARQVGKTTLAGQLLDAHGGPSVRFDLEEADDLARLEEPRLALGQRQGIVVIDEIQRRPDLFPALRVLVDRRDARARFLVLGSASPDLLRQTTETLAGRIAYHELDGLDLDEVGAGEQARLWLRGGFPRSLLASSDAESAEWRRQFVRTFLERDIPQLGIRVPAATSPKVYLADTGLLHTLLGLESGEDLDGHPKSGASWEGLVLREVATRHGARPEECFFWATQAGAEIDLLVVRGRKRRAFEVKRTTAPSTTRSMRAAAETLRLDPIDVIHAGAETFPLDAGIRAVAFARIHEDLEPLG